MCGITGLFLFNGDISSHSSEVAAATEALARRGPDASGTFEAGNCLLGHRRLSIIDTTSGANQPFTDHTKRFTIVFNGEVFNYKTLRSSLSANGTSFRTESDTEVLLEAYKKYGADVTTMIDGEFAFAIYDHEKRTLFAARDRYGIKPFFYFKDDSRFVFSSELKSLIRYKIPRVIDQSSLQQYLHLSYIASPYSIYENVRKLRSGHYLKTDTSGVLTEKPYYEINRNIISESFENAASQLNTLLEESVRNRMLSDVPLGTFLSGGLDSSVISMLAARNTDRLKTFSIGFRDEPYFDETKYAILVSKKIGTEHTVFNLGNDELYADLTNVLDYIDEPFADSSALAVNVLAMHTRKHVTVALSGDGADELFGGYNKHEAEWKARYPRSVEKIAMLASSIMGNPAGSRNSRLGNLQRQLKKFADGSKLSPQERYWLWAGFSKPDDDLLLKKGKEYLSRKDAILSEINDDFNSVLKTDVQLVLENDMLVKTDRMSMCNGLEVRVPFLDQRVVDFAFSLPPEYKISRHERKKVIREAFRNDLPAEIFSRKKHGFEVPLQKWFRNGLLPMINELLGDEFIRHQGIFNPETIGRLRLAALGRQPGDAVARVWSLIVFQYWWKKNFSL